MKITDENREEIIKKIAEEWTENVDIKDMLRSYYAESIEAMSQWKDEWIEEEYRELFEEEEEG